MPIPIRINPPIIWAQEPARRPIASPPAMPATTLANVQTKTDTAFGTMSDAASPFIAMETPTANASMLVATPHSRTLRRPFMS